jgi:hypothetical protein
MHVPKKFLLSSNYDVIMIVQNIPVWISFKNGRKPDKQNLMPLSLYKKTDHYGRGNGEIAPQDVGVASTGHYQATAKQDQFPPHFFGRWQWHKTTFYDLIKYKKKKSVLAVVITLT